MVHPIDIEPSAILRLSVEGSTFGVEPSVISTLSVEGPTLNSEPSAIHTLSVGGSTSDTRTFRDSCPERGRFRSRPRTFHEIDLHRGWFNPWYPNLPRYRPPPWTVRSLIPEPSAIHAQNVDGSLLRYELSMISTPSVESSPHRPRTIRDTHQIRGWFHLL